MQPEKHWLLLRFCKGFFTSQPNRIRRRSATRSENTQFNESSNWINTSAKSSCSDVRCSLTPAICHDLWIYKLRELFLICKYKMLLKLIVHTCCFCSSHQCYTSLSSRSSPRGWVGPPRVPGASRTDSPDGRRGSRTEAV